MVLVIWDAVCNVKREEVNAKRSTLMTFRLAFGYAALDGELLTLRHSCTAIRVGGEQHLQLALRFWRRPQCTQTTVKHVFLIWVSLLQSCRWVWFCRCIFFSPRRFPVLPLSLYHVHPCSSWIISFMVRIWFLCFIFSIGHLLMSCFTLIVSFLLFLLCFFTLTLCVMNHKQQHETKSDARVFGYIVSKYQDENSSQQSKMSQPQMTFTPNLSGLGNSQRLLHSEHIQDSGPLIYQARLIPLKLQRS